MMMMMRRLLFLRGGNHVYRRLSRSRSECVHTLRLSVSQNSQTLKFVLLSDDTERLRETERETFRERKVWCAKNKLRRAKRMVRLNVWRAEKTLIAREKKSFCFSLSLSCFFLAPAFFGSPFSLSKSFSLIRRRVSFPSLPQFWWICERFSESATLLLRNARRQNI